MANTELSILNGPSHWDLMISLFDRDYRLKGPRVVVFLVQEDGKTVEANVAITKMEQVGDLTSVITSWAFAGRIIGSSPLGWSRSVEGNYDTSTRKGRIRVHLEKQNPPESEKYQVGEIEIHKEFGRIMSVRFYHNYGVTLGQLVISSGISSVPKGTRGVVVALEEPYTEGRTTNILGVWWEDHTCSKDMKIKDILP